MEQHTYVDKQLTLYGTPAAKHGSLYDSIMAQRREYTRIVSRMNALRIAERLADKAQDLLSTRSGRETVSELLDTVPQFVGDMLRGVPLAPAEVDQAIRATEALERLDRAHKSIPGGSSRL